MLASRNTSNTTHIHEVKVCYLHAVNDRAWRFVDLLNVTTYETQGCPLKEYGLLVPLLLLPSAVGRGPVLHILRTFVAVEMVLLRCCFIYFASIFFLPFFHPLHTASFLPAFITPGHNLKHVQMTNNPHENIFMSTRLMFHGVETHTYIT